MDILKEACVENFCGALAASKLGAGRIELCDNLAAGGTTPSAGTIALTVDTVSIPAAVIIRPRGGDFAYTDEEKQIILADIAFAEEFSPEALVVGAIKDGLLDKPFMEKMRALIKNSKAVCHMAFDDTPNLEDSLELLISLGYDRVLTKGGAGSAHQNTETLKRLVSLAAGRITVMPGGGITSANVEEIARLTGAQELHGARIL